MKPDKFMTVTEAADALGVSRQRVLVLIEKKKLRSKMMGNYYLLNRIDVEKRIANRNKDLPI